MDRVLIDTSVWIDFFNNAQEPHVEKMASALKVCEVCICPPILQEVLQGIYNDRDFEITKHYLLELQILNFDQIQTSLGAATLYRYLRKKGVTIRKANDCLIAWLAIEFQIPLLENDRDFKVIAEHTALKLF